MFKKYFIESAFEKMFPGTNEYNTNTDKNGILLIDYVAHNLGKRFNPAAIALYALSQYNMFVDTGKDQYKESFLNHANWLVDNLKRYAAATIIQSILMVIVTVSLIYYGFGVTGAVIGVVLSSVVWCLFLIFVSRNYFEITLSEYVSTTKKVLIFLDQIFEVNTVEL